MMMDILRILAATVSIVTRAAALCVVFDRIDGIARALLALQGSIVIVDERVDTAAIRQA
jgi:hypothetical protein